MATLKIYRVSEKYIGFLHSVDYRVQFNKGQRRPYVGVVLEVNGYKYFVPMESPKENHQNIKNSVHIMKLKDGEYGILGFNNMIPVRDDCLIEFDIAKETDEKYRELLKNQLRFCNDNKERIYKRAAKTYDEVTVKQAPFYLKVCCDFKKLEKACKKYNPSYVPKKNKK